MATILFCVLSSCANLSAWFGNTSDAPDLGRIPDRAWNAISGSDFIRKTWNMTVEQREQAILAEIKSGNIPNFLRVLKAVHFKDRSAGGAETKATIWVMPDYLAIGSDQDFVRIPMNPITAQLIADYFGFMLPTRKMVDEIYHQATVKLRPSPMAPGKAMTSNSYYLAHNRTVQRQRGEKAGELGG